MTGSKNLSVVLGKSVGRLTGLSCGMSECLGFSRTVAKRVGARGVCWPRPTLATTVNILQLLPIAAASLPVLPLAMRQRQFERSKLQLLLLAVCWVALSPIDAQDPSQVFRFNFKRAVRVDEYFSRVFTSHADRGRLVSLIDFKRPGMTQRLARTANLMDHFRPVSC